MTKSVEGEFIPSSRCSRPPSGQMIAHSFSLFSPFSPYVPSLSSVALCLAQIGLKVPSTVTV